MPRAFQSYLVQGADGRVRTVKATSIVGAAKAYVVRYPTTPGDMIAVKKRGEGEWVFYQV